MGICCSSAPLNILSSVFTACCTMSAVYLVLSVVY